MSSQRVLLVTGAANGIGRDVARKAVARGDRVAIADVDATALQSVAKELGDAGGEVLEVVADVTDVAATERLAADVVARFGHIDVLVNNAGGVWMLAQIGRIRSNFQMFVETTPAEWEQIIRLNFTGTLNVTLPVLKTMIPRRSGQIVNVASVAALVGSEGLAVYAATKGAIVSFTKSLSREVARHGITVNSVAPSAVATRIWGTNPRKAEEKAQGIPMGRLATPEEIADAILFLGSEGARFITGQVLPVTGGPV